MRQDRLVTARLLALLIPVALLGGALGFQFIGHLVPCEMCVWQRWPHLGAIIVALLAFVVPTRPAKLLLVLIAAMLILLSGAIGVAHAGVEYHWWPGFTPCTSQLKTGLTADELLAAIAKQPVIRCDVAQWQIFGISLAGFNAIFSILGGLVVAGLALMGRRR